MSKRTERDEHMDQLIEEAITKRKADEEETFARLKLPLPELTSDEWDALEKRIEDEIVARFSMSQPSGNSIMFPAWDVYYPDPEDVITLAHMSVVFKKTLTFYNWVLNCIAARTVSGDHIARRRFSDTWMDTQLKPFLDALMQKWNEKHVGYVMGVSHGNVYVTRKE